MIIRVSGERHYRLRTAFKPFRGTFYSQLSYDTIFAKTPLPMTEDELLWHIQIGNMNIPPARMQATLSQINAYRRNFGRKADIVPVPNEG